ncbi:MAG: thioredoxin domain-containing protein [Armatimonadetes bacterium]|nr:thioredoxin domain-containing protein [Armatimonadota bacterium]
MAHDEASHDGRPHNRLLYEKSPYLLQHAYNPVDWHPWGEEAFEKAAREDKPVFLSIGYSTCHWCHVMERESFEDEEAARLLNETFVCIKVDREERPDIDSIYMAACQMMTGSGGWPLTIIMTPDRKPFFAGTYFPKESRFGAMGLMDLTRRIADIWEARRADALDSARQIAQAVQDRNEYVPGDEPGRVEIQNAFSQLSGRFDRRHGGFGSAPKFPTPHQFLFLLRYWKRTGDRQALGMVEKTLQSMRLGGIYDHVGFGFHRYSTDARWLLPHFEKMLYDQAMLALAYTETCQATGKEQYARTAREILTYVLRDMTSPEGGFYSAEDADSEGEEGKFYVWSEAEIREALSPEEARIVLQIMNVRQDGNFEDQATRRKTGDNILHLTKIFEEEAFALKMPEAALVEQWESAREKLFGLREKRIHPHKDDKILTDWNGLMILALARAAQAFEEPAYEEAARRAADFILTELRTPEGRLLHRYRDGQAGLPAHVDDYAFLIRGLIELYEASLELRYLQTALELNDTLIARYWDEEQGGFYFTADDSEALLSRPKEIYDGAVPSGNSVAMENLLRLGRMTARPGLEAAAARIGRAFSGAVRQMPSAYTQLLVAVDFALGPSYEAVVVGQEEAEDTRQMLAALRKEFIPNKVVLFKPAGEGASAVVALAPFTQDYTAPAGKAAAYVCRDYRCNLPATEPERMIHLLQSAD